MTGCLLDTNVVSELTRASPDAGVVSFLSERDELWLSTIVFHELEYGVRCLSPGNRRVLLFRAINSLVASFQDQILPVDRKEAEWAARLRADAQRSGRVLHLADSLIAGTAKANELALATRNVSDFEGTGIEIVNPWDRQTITS